MRQQMEAQLRLKKSTTYLDVLHIRSSLRSACTGHTEHSIEVELELNDKITLHIHFAASEFGMWYAPYELSQIVETFVFLEGVNKTVSSDHHDFHLSWNADNRIKKNKIFEKMIDDL